MDDDRFADLVKRARAGDDRAAHDLLLRYQADVRTMVRVRLPRLLRTQFDSMDFTQAVWASVFVNLRESDETFRDEGQLRGFLAGVVRNKINEQHRRQTTKKYDVKRVESLYSTRNGREQALDVAGHDPTPSQKVVAEEQLDRMVGGSAQAAKIARLRADGLSYEEIGKKLGISDRSVRRIVETMKARLEDAR